LGDAHLFATDFPWDLKNERLWREDFAIKKLLLLLRHCRTYFTFAPLGETRSRPGACCRWLGVTLSNGKYVVVRSSTVTIAPFNHRMTEGGAGSSV
jgi:hypothetical protein